MLFGLPFDEQCKSRSGARNILSAFFVRLSPQTVLDFCTSLLIKLPAQLNFSDVSRTAIWEFYTKRPFGLTGFQICRAIVVPCILEIVFSRGIATAEPVPPTFLDRRV